MTPEPALVNEDPEDIPWHDESGASAGQVVYRLARELMIRGEYWQAAVLFEASAKLSPHFKTLELLGECYLALGRPSEAIAPLAAACTLSSQFRAPTLLAEAFLTTGDVRSAAEAIDLALSKNPTYKRALALRQRIEKETRDAIGGES